MALRKLLPHFILILLASREVICTAATIYVNNRTGSDAFNGRSTHPIGNNGPVRTVRRAVQLAKAGDTISILGDGQVYHETVQVSGRDNSGAPQHMFTILGNGAVFSGSKPVPKTAWKSLGNDLWTVTPWRKGYYLLLRDEQVLPEHEPADASEPLKQIPPGHWRAWKGAIYYRQQDVDDSPAERDFSIAGDGVGLTLYEVENVRIVDITFRHFRVDGISVPDNCRNVVLENVKSIENGRCGLNVSGTSLVGLINSELTKNRIDQLRISQRAGVHVEKSNLSQPPTVLP